MLVWGLTCDCSKKLGIPHLVVIWDCDVDVDLGFFVDLDLGF